MAGTYLTRSTTTRTNDRKFTYSCWFKKSTTGTDEYLVINYEDANNRGYIANGNTDKFIIYDKAGGTERLQAESNFVLRDTSAWYHLVYSVDSTAGSNRVKFYINGVDRYSDFTVTTAMSQNVEVGFQKGVVSNGFKIGSQESGAANFNGLMSHVNFVDGLQLDASAFGQYDANGVWTIKTSPTVSEYGNNGFFILKDSGSKTDQSGKGNNFSEEGTPGIVSNTQDNPSNVFATLNPLVKPNDYTLSQGNNTIAYGSASTRACCLSTLGMSSGKFYAELKVTASSTSPCQASVGITNQSDNGQLGYYPNQGGTNQAAAYQFWDGNKNISQVGATYGATVAANDIMGFAFDIDNKAMYVSKNGVWQGSGVPTSGASKTNAIDFSSITDNGFWFLIIGDGSGVQTFTSSFNFGNGYFGTTAVSSAGTNASGNGIFEYDVPTGYTALSTKGLNL